MAYASELTFNRPTDRLEIFAEREMIEIFDYLEARGIKLKRPPGAGMEGGGSIALETMAQPAGPISLAIYCN